MATHNSSPEPRPFSIPLPRPLWIGVAVVGLLVLAAGLRFGLAIHREHAAIREIERLGGKIETRRGRPEWLRNRLGDDSGELLDEVVTVDLNRTPANDTTLSQIRFLTGVKSLSLDFTQVTDSGLACLKEMSSLQELRLDLTHVTDAGMAELAGLSELETLLVAVTPVSDAGLVHLKGLRKLKYLWVSATNVTDTGIAELKGAIPELVVVR